MNPARHRPPPAVLVLALTFALGLGACASDGPITPGLEERPVVAGRESVVPDGVAEQREVMAEQRSQTLEQMNTGTRNAVGPGADGGDSGTPWYTPLTSIFSFASRLAPWLW